MNNRRSSQSHVPRNTPARGRAATTSFLLEIGSEELPWQVIEPAMRDLAQLMEDFLAQHRLSHDAIRAYGTPRRLAVIVTGLAVTQSPMVRETLGPSVAVAFTDQGRPTKAAEGFAQSQGMTVAQLETRETPRGDYLCAVTRERGAPVARVLTAHLSGRLRQLTFPKTMRWNASGVRYPRPIRWLVALLGAKVVPMEFAGVRAGARSWGHRLRRGQHAPLTLYPSPEGRGNKDSSPTGRGAGVRGADKGVLVTRPESYEGALARAGVVVDPGRRRDILDRRLSRLAGAAKGRVHPDARDALLDQAVFSLEWPNLVGGAFDRKYLALPPETLMTSMREHQGFFAVVNVRGALLPRFVAPINVDVTDMALVRVGLERVLAARLADARYFFDDDRKTPLAERVPQLHGVVFHQRLGSLHQKTERVMTLIEALATDAGVPELTEACRRAAFLSKADLLTGMVGEFPTLQGVMGGHYAAHDGESGQVRDALGEYYQPRTPDDAPPVTTVGRLLSFADRVDTLAAFFHAGLIPSGSEDPYGLRRHAFGLIRIARDAGVNIEIGTYLRRVERMLTEQGIKAAPPQGDKAAPPPGDKAAPPPGDKAAPPPGDKAAPPPGDKAAPPQGDKAAPPQGDKAAPPPGDMTAGPARPPALFGFLEDRLRYYGRLASGYRDDVMASVLARRNPAELDLRDLLLRMEALQAVTGHPGFDQLMVGFKRAHRIVAKEGWTSDAVTAALLTHPTERDLHRAVDAAAHVVEREMAGRDYHAVLHGLMALKVPVDRFFDGVLVNAPEAGIRANRLSLLCRVDALFSAFGDLSRMQGRESTLGQAPDG